MAIKWVQFSKQGIVAKVQPKVGAGSSVELLINWNIAELSGDLEGQIALRLNDPKNPEVILLVSGTVIQ